MSGLAFAGSADEADELSSGFRQLYQEGRYSEAVPLAEQSLIRRVKKHGPDHPSVGKALNNLATLYIKLGRYAEAEYGLKRSLTIVEKVYGTEHPIVARSLDNIGSVLQSQGLYSEAEQHFQRSLNIRRKVLRPEHPDIGTGLNNLALLYRAAARYDEAIAALEQSVSIAETSLGSEHPQLAVPLANLALLKQTVGRYDEAERTLARATALLERHLGPEHPDVATLLNNLALLHQARGDYAKADAVLGRSLSIRKTRLGLDHPDVAVSYHNLAFLALERNELRRAADAWEQATAIVQRRSLRGGGGEALRHRWYFDGLIKTTFRLEPTQGDGRDAFAISMFEAAQQALVTEASAALAQSTARLAGHTPDLAVIVRERQDHVAEWEKLDRQLAAARSQSTAPRDLTLENALLSEIGKMERRLIDIDKTLMVQFNDYDSLVHSRSASVVDVQASLRNDEALVLVVDTDARIKPLPEETFVWVVTKSEVRWLRSMLGTEALQREVSALRCGLDATAWHGEGSKRCADLLKLPPEQVPMEGQALPFDAVRAHALYKSLLAEAVDLIKGKHLLIVPSGTLTTLPFQVLVTEPPKPGDLKLVRWLARDHAITVLPSVASLKALRRTGKPSAAPNLMIGFGNPLLDGDQAHPQNGAYYKQQAQIARAQTGCAKSPQQRTATLRVVSRSLGPLPVSGRTTDLNHLRMQTPLPETADELCEVARSVGGSIEDVRIGARATETEVKRLSSSGELAKYRILHFATHGMLAGQLKGTSEPGLILTPPKAATEEDDGYLSGSEIASLKLDADWVILSACNTAGGAGEGEAAEALSGLARVFFYAGARALLVSHWEVDSAATVKLITTAMAELSKDKVVGRAEAMRRAMLAVMADTARPANWVPAWHPSVWAPFVVVGEGGVGR